MKRVTAISLLLLYSLTLVGLGVKQFYCCGKLMDTSLGLATSNEHHCKMDEQKKGCCETAFKTLKVEDSHFSAEGANIPATFFFTLVGIQVPCGTFEPLIERPYHIHYGNGPPLYSRIPTYMLNCIYRI